LSWKTEAPNNTVCKEESNLQKTTPFQSFSYLFCSCFSHLRIERSSKLLKASSRAVLEAATRLRLKAEAVFESYPLIAAAACVLWKTDGRFPPPPFEVTRLEPRLSPCSPDELGLLPEATASPRSTAVSGSASSFLRYHIHHRFHW